MRKAINNNETGRKEAFEEPVVEIVKFESVDADKIRTSGFEGEWDE